MGSGGSVGGIDCEVADDDFECREECIDGDAIKRYFYRFVQVVGVFGDEITEKKSGNL